MKNLISKMNKTLVAVSLILVGITAAPSIASAVTFECAARDVYEYSGRIHVYCTNSITLDGDKVRFVAIAKTDADQAARFVSMATAAILSGKTFRTSIPESSSSNVSGCKSKDCRTPYGFGLVAK